MIWIREQTGSKHFSFSNKFKVINAIQVKMEWKKCLDIRIEEENDISF